MKKYFKLSMVVLLLLCTSAIQAQDFFEFEPFKAKKEVEEIADFNNLLKLEYQGDFNETQRVHFEESMYSEWEEAPIDKYYPQRGTRNFVNVYLGLSNYLENGELPSSNDIYSLNPIASWYGAVSFDNITKLFSVFYLDWGIGTGVQEYAFENTRTRIIQTDDAIEFVEATDIKGRKSKIKMWHLNAHLVPTLAFGKYNSFRVGFGMYGGYRLSSSVIYKYDDANGNKQKDKNQGNWNLNQFRYGLRATMGWDFFDIFFNYELTELFEDNIDAPRLNPVTFGVIF